MESAELVKALGKTQYPSKYYTSDNKMIYHGI